MPVKIPFHISCAAAAAAPLPKGSRSVEVLQTYARCGRRSGNATESRTRSAGEDHPFPVATDLKNLPWLQVVRRRKHQSIVDGRTHPALLLAPTARLGLNQRSGSQRDHR